MPESSESGAEILESPNLVLMAGSQPGEVLGGALAPRLRAFWRIVDFDLGADDGGVRRSAWNRVLANVSARVDSEESLDGVRWFRIDFPERMPAVLDSIIDLADL